MVALALPGTDEVHKVSIIPRGVGALGYTIQRPTDDRFLMTRMELENKMAVLMGGRAAEQVVFNEISTGATDDLARCTDLARAMVLRYGMSGALGNVSYDRDRPNYLQAGMTVPQSREYSEETANAVDNDVRALVEHALERSVAILQCNPVLLDEAAEELLATETLNQPEIEALKKRITAGPDRNILATTEPKT
jgi:cell division protease FtsH